MLVKTKKNLALKITLGLVLAFAGRNSFSG